MIAAIAIFGMALALIASDRFDRTKVALTGGVLIVLTRTLEQDHAIGVIDFNTLGLLAGMMILVRITETSGVYSWLAIRVARLSRGSPPRLVAALAVFTALLSAFLDSVTMVLFLVPITFSLADVLEIDPGPLVILEIVIANIGGTATLIGDPPNILIGGHTGLPFMGFITNLAPVAAACVVLVTGGLYVAYRSRLRVPADARRRIAGLDPRAAIEDHVELRRTVPVLVLTIATFFVHKPLQLEPATVALAGAAACLLVSRMPAADALAGIEWPTLFFLLGLFVMVGALEETGALAAVTDGIAAVTGGERTAELVAIIWVGGLGGALVDNIPFTAAMIPVVDPLAGDDAYWWALALGACYSGNATLVAAGANIAASGMAARAGRPIGFLEFMRIGVPVTLVTLTIATGYVLARYA